MEVVKESVVDLFHGHVVVGVTRVRVISIELQPMLKGILVRAPGSGDPIPNAATVWLGGTGVTADSNKDTGGMPLPPGECMFVPLEHVKKLYAISTVANQDLAWMAM